MERSLKSAFKKKPEMRLYEITVFKLNGTKRERITGMEVQARDPVNALELSCIHLNPDRAILIRESHPVKIQKEGSDAEFQRRDQG